MKGILLLSMLCIWIAGVWSSALAGPYQTALMWYAYRMDVEDSKDGKPTVIAPGCSGDILTDKSCTFKEFVTYIMDDKNQANKAWKSADLHVPADLKTDVDTLAKGLADTGYPSIHSPAKLAAVPYAGTFSNEIGRVIDRIQACRVSLGDDRIQFELEESRKAIVTVLQARRAEQAAAHIRGIRAKFSTYGLDPSNLKLKTTSFSRRVGLDTWDEPDVQATHVEIENNESRSQKLTNAIRAFASTFGTSADQCAKQARNQNMAHQKAINACQGFQNRLHGDPGC